MRFLKKHWWSHKSSDKSVPPETPTHQITDIGARDSDGEYLSRNILELTRPMGLIRPSGQIPTMGRVLESQLRTRGPVINNFLRRLPRPRLLNARVAMQVSTADRCCWDRCSFPVAHRGSEGALNEGFGRNTSDLRSILIDVPKEVTGGFGLLKAVLEVIPTIYANYEVRPWFLDKISLLTTASAGIYPCREQGRRPPLTCSRTGSTLCNASG